MKEILEKLDGLVDDIEGLEPASDCEAYVRRELLAALDRAHELLASLVNDQELETAETSGESQGAETK